MVLTVQILVDGLDLTRWCTSVSVTQAPRTYYRSWSATFRGLPVAITAASVVDILLGGQTVMVDGCLSPDAVPTVSLDGTVPTLVCTGFDWAWRMQRIAPRSTLVLAPSRQMARQAAELSEFAVGRWEWVAVHTAREACQTLGTRAGLTVDYCLPDYTLAPTVLDPRATLWDSLYGLVECFKPEVFWRRERRALILADPLANVLSGIGSLSLPASAVVSAEVKPTQRITMRRLLMTVR